MSVSTTIRADWIGFGKYTESITGPEQGVISVSDIIGFMRLSKALSEQELAFILAFMADHHRHFLQGSGGEIIKYIGDSALMVFPADIADRAINLVADMRLDFVERLERETGLSGVGLDLSVHVGQFHRVLMPPLPTADLVGMDVNTAFRLRGGGDYRRPAKGEVILSPQAFRSLRPESRKRFHKYTAPVIYRGE